jgi:hypothetical protein
MLCTSELKLNISKFLTTDNNKDNIYWEYKAKYLIVWIVDDKIPYFLPS